MIPAEEAQELGQQLGVPLHHVEKDYVMGWLLWAISRHSELQSTLVLKGGNCLRKLYFPDTRFSDDLDFTTVKQVSGHSFASTLGMVLSTAGEASGITFAPDRTRVEEVQTPDPDEHALDARVYFRGFAGDSALVFRIKFDVSPYEQIVLPLRDREILHGYSDAAQCRGTVRAYSLEEVVAEKLRSWIQRTRARDLFDVAKIISSGQIDVRKRDVLNAFLQKTLFKGIPAVAREELLSTEKFSTVAGHWLASIVCPSNAMILAANAVQLFTQFVEAMFEPEIASAIASRARSGAASAVSRVPEQIRESIISAGRDRHLLSLTYSGVTRLVEPYALKYKIRKDGVAAEYFYGYDRTRGNSIKSFFLHKVQSASPRAEAFTPRYAVEF